MPPPQAQEISSSNSLRANLKPALPHHSPKSPRRPGLSPKYDSKKNQGKSTNKDLTFNIGTSNEKSKAPTMVIHNPNHKYPRGPTNAPPRIAYDAQQNGNERLERTKKFLSKISECYDQPEKRHKLFL